MTLTGDWARLHEFVDNRYKDASLNLCKGGAKSFETYREEVGYLRALKQVADEMNKIAGTEYAPFMNRE